jgi:hypothetical protein
VGAPTSSNLGAAHWQWFSLLILCIDPALQLLSHLGGVLGAAAPELVPASCITFLPPSPSGEAPGTHNGQSAIFIFYFFIFVRFDSRRSVPSRPSILVHTVLKAQFLITLICRGFSFSSLFAPQGGAMGDSSQLPAPSLFPKQTASPSSLDFV